MPYLQPTVRQIQPLGRRHHSALVSEEVDNHARAAVTVSPNAETSAPRGRRRRHWLPARATLS
jgi:hypothetical protein